jgi:monoamine oxidase
MKSTLSAACLGQLRKTKVAIVGGGFAGLMAARVLGEYGVNVTLFEARSQLGGRVLSNTTFSKGHITEEGAELIGAFHTYWLTLAQKYGLTCINRMNDESYWLEGLNSKLTLDAPLSNQEVEDLWDDADKRVLRPMAQLASQIQHESQPWSNPTLKQYDNMSVAEALTNLYGVKRGERLWKAMVFLLVNNEVAPLEEMNFLGLLCKVKGGQGERFGTKKTKQPNLMGYWEDLEIFRCADGCQKLATEMAKEIQTLYKAKILLKTAVIHINIQKGRVVVASKKIRGGKVFEDMPPFPIPYDYVILAIPPSVWADVMITADGKDAHPKNQIGLMGMNPAVKFFSDMKGRFWIKEKPPAAPNGGSLTLGQVWEGTDNQTRVGNQGIVLSVFAGPIIPIPLAPGKAPHRAPTPDECKKELRKLYPGYSSNLTKTLFSDWPNVPFIKTGYASPKKGEIFSIGKKLSEPFRGRLFFAGEHTRMDFFGYMEGALRSGEDAAVLLMKQACGLLKEPEPASSSPALIANAKPIPERTAFEREVKMVLDVSKSRNSANP